MTEPVAYRSKDKDETAYCLTNEYPDGRWDIIQPLYTAEQLHPRVKMMQAEFDEFIGLYGKEYGGRGNVFFGLDQAINLGYYYPYLNKRLITDKQFDDNFAQAEFVNLWIKFDPSHPEETIEIVHDMKWFVRTKKLAENSKYLWLCDAEYLNVPQCMFTNDNQLTAMRFDTKEEAELWTNPLTEAVQLPVEGQ